MFVLKMKMTILRRKRHKQGGFFIPEIGDNEKLNGELLMIADYTF